jgi:hypothetical protein
MHTGRLIDELFAAVESAEKASRELPRSSSANENLNAASSCGGAATGSSRATSSEILRENYSEAEQFPQPLGLCAADWYLGLLLIVHAELIRTLEPRHDFADAIDIDQVRTMRPPEKIAV